MSNKKIVLLVDDNEADNVYHEIILRRCHEVKDVVIMESATAALGYLKQSSAVWPHLMLVDVNMPGMDGFTLVRELEALPLPTSCKIAMLSSSDAEQDRDRALNLKLVSNYIIKPLTLPAVLSMLA